MATGVTKAVIPAAGLGTRFLPVTKSQPKEMLPVVDKPSIQYVVEEAVTAGLTDILIITGRGKHAIEDHFDRNFELEHYLEQSGKLDQLGDVKVVNDIADIHYIRQREPLGLGHAVNVAREHVGDAPFAVLLGDDIMVDNAALLESMLAVYEGEHASCLALLEVTPAELASLGCAEVDMVSDSLGRVRSLVEKPKPEEAPSNLAVIGRYVFTPSIFDALDRIEPGVNGEYQLTDAIALLLESEPVFGRVFSEGRYDIGKVPGFLQANIELALERDDLGPDLAKYLAELVRTRALVIEFGEVRSAILAAVDRLEPVEVPSSEALGLVLATDVASTGPIPPFANTAMDGYAVRAQSTAGATLDAPVRLRVVGELPAGHEPTVPVGDGEAIRIMTGAPMPDGADAIVIVELTERDGDDGVLVQQEAKAGDHVRRAGGDVGPGEVVFRAGTVLGPAHLGVLASIDVGRVQVYRRARVGVLSTGDELVESGELSPGKIRDANRPMLLALLEQAGVEAVNLGMARDDEAQMTAALEDALARCDAIITSGGVSVGDYDYMSATLERIAADDPDGRSRVNWYQVAIRPAKPLCFAVVRGRPVFGLPGNPVSSLVSFELFARPALLAMMGHTECFRAEVNARAEHAFARKPDGKLHFDRVTVRVDDGSYVVASVGKQESNTLAATALADGLVLLPDGDGVGEGDDVRVILLD